MRAEIATHITWPIAKKKTHSRFDAHPHIMTQTKLKQRFIDSTLKANGILRYKFYYHQSNIAQMTNEMFPVSTNPSMVPSCLG